MSRRRVHASFDGWGARLLKASFAWAFIHHAKISVALRAILCKVDRAFLWAAVPQVAHAVGKITVTVAAPAAVVRPDFSLPVAGGALEPGPAWGAVPGCVLAEAVFAGHRGG